MPCIHFRNWKCEELRIYSYVRYRRHSKKDSTSILTGYQTEDGTESDAVTFQSESDPDALGIAVDLGTTTVAMELVQLATGATISQHGFLNPQIKYGSDVISRIKKGQP